MGNKAKQSSSNRQSSVKVSNSKSVQNQDSRSYQNTDSRSYQNTDSRSYKNVDSRDMSTNVNNVDNRNISETALDCGVKPSDVDNYTNDESININQDNSQNIVVTGDGNTLENISQKMNLTSYAPSVQKCMQDAVTEMASKNQTDLATKKANKSSAASDSSTTSESASDNQSGSSNDLSSGQSSQSSQKDAQSSTQKSELKQIGGMGAAGGLEIILGLIVILIVYYSSQSLDSNNPNPLRMLTEIFQNSFTSTHLIMILLLIIVIYEALN